jgi:hypothetical protein
MSKSNEQKIVWGPCCFCGEQIAETEIDPCSIAVETAGKKWQTWFCHAKCFRQRLAPIPMLEPEFF